MATDRPGRFDVVLRQLRAEGWALDSAIRLPTMVCPQCGQRGLMDYCVFVQGHVRQSFEVCDPCGYWLAC